MLSKAMKRGEINKHINHFITTPYQAYNTKECVLLNEL